MAEKFIICGTDTDVGKTVFAAGLTQMLEGVYFKPLQSGEPADNDTVRALSGLSDDHFLPEVYKFSRPLSPHYAAELDDVEINTDKLVLPEMDKPLIVETAGGLLVPVTREILQIDFVKHWDAPVILCARTGLGTLNHTLLSVEALRARNIQLHGIAFIGEDNPDNMRTIAEFSNAKILGRLPMIDNFDKNSLAAHFAKNFNRGDFL